VVAAGASARFGFVTDTWQSYTVGWWCDHSTWSSTAWYLVLPCV